MDGTNRSPKLWQVNLVIFIILLFVTTLTDDSLGVHADLWIIPVIIAGVGLIGAIIGGVLGGLVGLIGELFKKGVFVSGMKLGATIGYVGILIFWFTQCWMNGSSVCFAQ